MAAMSLVIPILKNVGVNDIVNNLKKVIFLKKNTQEVVSCLT